MSCLQDRSHLREFYSPAILCGRISVGDRQLVCKTSWLSGHRNSTKIFESSPDLNALPIWALAKRCPGLGKERFSAPGSFTHIGHQPIAHREFANVAAAAVVNLITFCKLTD